MNKAIKLLVDIKAGKEIGICEMPGVDRGALVVQFIGEAFLMAFAIS